MPQKKIFKVFKARSANPAIPVQCGIPFMKRVWVLVVHELGQTKLAVVVVVVRIGGMVPFPVKRYVFEVTLLVG